MRGNILKEGQKIMRKLAVLLTPLLFWQCVPSDLARVRHVRVVGPMDGSSVLVEFDLAWRNSFRDSVNWDGAWVFVKFRVAEGPWRHATLSPLPQSHSVGDTRGVPAGVQPSPDGVGAFVYRTAQGAGPVDWRDVRLQWNHARDDVTRGSEVDVRVMAIEMVHVPDGVFALGDGERGDVRGHFHGPTPALPFVVTSEDPLVLGGRTAGRVSSNNGYGMSTPFPDDFHENAVVTLPARFPKGFAAFWIMKYELTQDQYGTFLNTLSDRQLRIRNPADDPDMARPGIEGYSLAAVRPFTATVGDRSAHFLSWMDGAAFADWAGLRPVTEPEFEKAARGSVGPTAGEYAWGSDDIHDRRYAISQAGTPHERVNNPGRAGNAVYAGSTGGETWCWSCLRGPLRVAAFRREGATRAEMGVSYYGVFDLSGNLVERAVTIGTAAGRRFDGSHGDGNLNGTGNAAGIEVSRWPGSSSTGARSQVIGAMGTGFRGGHWASPARNLRISDREFAATPDNVRHSTFGYRFARTAFSQ
jgi:formylglycine-generating enzyme required for sulfatase activity